MTANDVFFGIFWYSVIYSCNRYRPFETHRLIHAPTESGSTRGQTWARLGVAVVLLNLLPILGIWFLGTRAVGKGFSLPAIASAGFAALSVLSITRIFHGVVITEWWEAFYSPDERDKVLEAWRKEDWNQQPNSWTDHLLPGAAHLGVYVGLAFLFKGAS